MPGSLLHSNGFPVIFAQEQQHAGKEPTASQIRWMRTGTRNLGPQAHLHPHCRRRYAILTQSAGETQWLSRTDDRPDGEAVIWAYDTDLNALLYWNGSEWVPFGNEAIAINDLNDVTDPVDDGSLFGSNSGTTQTLDCGATPHWTSPLARSSVRTAPADQQSWSAVHHWLLC